MLVADGRGGAALAGICCVAPFLVAGLLAAVGLGFVLDDIILIGLLIMFVAVALIGYYFRERAKRA